MNQSKLIEIYHLSKSFNFKMINGKKKKMKVLNDLNFNLLKDEILGIVGPSGCGKSTLAKIMMGLLKPDEGQMLFQNQDWFKKKQQNWKMFYHEVQLLFQNASQALDPKWKIKKILNEAIDSRLDDSLEDLLLKVGLTEDYLLRYPHQMSGGQRQRVAIARALLRKPNVLICDEITAGLDLTIQAQIMKVLLRIRKEYGLTVIFISHDLSLVKVVCDRIMVLDHGEKIELGTVNDIFNKPKSILTQNMIKNMNC